METPPPTVPTWTRAENDAFEAALVSFPNGTPERWRKIAGEVAGKSSEEVKRHYDALVDDVIAISSGLVPLPVYNDEPPEPTPPVKIEAGKKKGKAWSEEEHLSFLEGLKRYGKGDWRSISRNVVKSKTATQVASHAQKYFNRLNAKNKGRRASIHDLTLNVLNSIDNSSSVQSSYKDNKFGFDNVTNMNCNQEGLFVTNSDSISSPSQVANHRGFSQWHDNNNSDKIHLHNPSSLRETRIPQHLSSPSARFSNHGGVLINGHPSNMYYQEGLSEYENFTMLRNKFSVSTSNQFTIENNGNMPNMNAHLMSSLSQFSPNGTPMGYYHTNITGQSTPPAHRQHMNSHMSPQLPNSQTIHTPHRSLYMGNNDTKIGSYVGLCDNQVEANDGDSSSSSFLPNQSPNGPKQSNF